MEEELEQIGVTITRINSPGEFWIKLCPDNPNQKQNNRTAQNQAQSNNRNRPESLAKGIFNYK